MSESKLSFDRVVNFSDAVMAIVITILVLELKIPAHSDNLEHDLVEMIPEFQAFLLSFIIVGVLWLEHHKLFRLIARYNVGLLVLNLIFLLCVCFVVFPTGLLAKYPTSFTALTMYYSTIGIASLSRFALIVWSIRTKILRNIDQTAIRKIRDSALVVPVVCLISIITAYLTDNLLATGVFVMSPVLIKILQKRLK